MPSTPFDRPTSPLRAYHPFLFALFPLGSLYTANVAEVPPVSLLRPALVLLFVAAFLWLSWRALSKNALKAALITSATLVLFFSYDHVVQVLRKWPGLGWQLGRNRILMPFWVLLLLVVIGATLRSRRDLRGVTSLLNAFAGACLSVAVAQSALGWLQFQRTPSEPLPPIPIAQGVAAPDAPDIFYIILDAYGRSDTLRAYYGYDNTPFVRALEKRGFFVAPRSQSNYSQTALSLSSSLNLSYHSDLARRMGSSNDRRPLFKEIQNSKVASFLRARGYDVVCITSGADWVQTAGARVVDAGRPVTSIEELLFDSTMLHEVPQAAAFRYNQRRRLLSYALEQLPKAANHIENNSPPRFVFAHILAPHPPFVWNEKGEPVNPPHPYYEFDGPIDFSPASLDEYRRGYCAQIQALNTQILQAVDGIRANSRRPPIIIIQGDHGPSVGRTGDQDNRTIRMAMLNAFCLPPTASPLSVDARPYSTISPVNNFRIVFNRTFKTHFPLLPDHSYYSSWEHPYEFSDATGRKP